jgi:dienelactone hydrolase
VTGRRNSSLVRRRRSSPAFLGRWLLTAPVVVALLAAGCSGVSPSPSEGPTQAVASSATPAVSPEATVAATVRPSPSLPPELVGSTAVSFSADDGIHLEGRLFGSGPIGVILAHCDEPDAAQGTWFPFATDLAKAGYLVLTFDFRGYCPRGFAGCSAGPSDRTNTWHDVVGAMAFLKQGGARVAFLIGASLGAHTVLWAAAQPGVTVAGVVALAGGLGTLPGYTLTPSMMARIAAPKLFIASLHDATQPDAAEAARALFKLARQPKQLVLIDSLYHGAELLTGDGKDIGEAKRVVLAFLKQYASRSM